MGQDELHSFSVDGWDIVSMRGGSGSSAWWFGRAIRLYFAFSISISTLWLAKLFYATNSVAPLSPSPIVQQEADAAATGFISNTVLRSSAHTSNVIDLEESIQLGTPSTEYSQAFTDHIYCISEETRTGRRARMTELLRYLGLLQGSTATTTVFSKSQAQHIDVWRDIINNGYARALVLEDNVDFEIDAIATIDNAIGVLEKTGADWDIVYIGHCSMEEDTGSKIAPPLRLKHNRSKLYRSVHPFCTSGYLLSTSGAQKLYAYFSKNTSQKHALDVQLVALIKRKMLQSYSLHPPVVYQRRDLYPSDDGLELKVAHLFRNSAWDEALAFEPHLANWTDPPDHQYEDPAYSQIPRWMEDRNQVN
ncbi:hypothetical protein GGI11_001970 [Coemansia sp. RSA 2049]|nr:hypothetical protein GGI11_001970 [Coemansia sp. RSA 2049]